MSTPTPAPHDVNFCFPVRELEDDRVKLTPFIPARHAHLFFQASSSHPELYQHLPFGPYPSPRAFTEDLIYGRIQPDSGMVLYAILDRTQTSTRSSLTKPDPDPGNSTLQAPASSIVSDDFRFAGIIGYLNSSPVNLSVEIGFVIVLPQFQGTHVATNAVGLLLRYALDLPTASPPGLGLRRVQWQTSETNGTSIRVAERMGFKREGRLRWDRIFLGGKGKVGNGEDVREGDPRPGTLGRHTVVLGLCWDDWENGCREQVVRLMNR